MAGNSVPSTVNPNYHMFGPDAIETELAKIAAGGGGIGGSPGASGRAALQGFLANQRRQADQSTYMDRIQQADQTRERMFNESQVMQERLKAISALATAAGGGHVPVGALLRALNGPSFGGSATGTEPTDPEIKEYDTTNLGREQADAVSKFGSGVNTAAEGGQGLNIGSMPAALQHIIGQITPIAPTGVRKAQVEHGPKVTVGLGQPDPLGQYKNQVSGSPDDVLSIVHRPDMQQMVASGGKGMTGIPTDGLAGNRTNDASNVKPQHYDLFNSVQKWKQSLGQTFAGSEQSGPSTRLYWKKPDGSYATGFITPQGKYTPEQD